MTLRKKLRFAVPGLFIFILALISRQTPAKAAEPGPPPVIDVSEIHPGMKGYGLSVFQGRNPARFQVEVIDVLPNALARQDLILVRCSGQGLEKSKIVAGMSGSPVYLEGRLAGAIAYGWSFSLDPVAGVTPVKYMMETMKRAEEKPGKTAARAFQVPRASSPLAARAFRQWLDLETRTREWGNEDLQRSLASPAPGSPEPSSPLSPGALTRLPAALLVSGLPPSLLGFLEREFRGLDMVPVAGGALSSPRLDPSAARELKPGDAVGAMLMAGDISMTAVGTLTLRQGDKVAAFGHPFLSGGELSLPLVSARIHTVVSTQAVSFKVGTPEKVVGELVRDEQAAVSGILGRNPETVPMKVRISWAGKPRTEEFNLYLAQDSFLTPILVRIGLFLAIRSAAPSKDPTTVRATTRMELEGYGKVEYQDVYAASRSNFSMGYDEPVMFLASNPFEEVKLKKISVELEITDALKVAFIDSLRANTDEVSPGDTVQVQVRLLPYNEPAREYEFKFRVPEDLKGRRLMLRVSGGNQALPDAAMPKSVADMLEFMKAVQPANHLVLMYQAPGDAVDLQGKRLKNLPPSVSSVLQPANEKDAGPAPQFRYLALETPYVILGSRMFALELDHGAGKRRRR